MFMPGVWILWSKKKNFVIIFQKENGNTFTLFIIFIVKSLQKEHNSTNLLLWPPICRNKPAITPKWFNYFGTNSNKNACLFTELVNSEVFMRVTKRIVLTLLTKALYKFVCFKEKVWSFLKLWIWQQCYFTELPWDDFACKNVALVILK